MRKSANASTKSTIWNTKDLQPGATLEGVYTNSEVFEGKFGDTNKYVVINDTDTWAVFGSASLDRQFNKIKPGSYVWIEYKGLETSKNGRQVKVYSVDYDDDQAF